jgi:PAS domain S-box-containing protein
MARRAVVELAVSDDPVRSELPPAESRLEIVERVFSADDPAECARLSLEWLGEAVGLREGICATFDPDGRRLVGLAGLGVPEATLRALDVGIDAIDHPLVIAFLGSSPIEISSDAGSSAHGWPLSPGPVLAVPVGGAGRAPVALLAVSPISPAIAETARWLADRLAPRLARPAGGGQDDADRVLARERERLRKILGAISDPVLVTDAGGRMVVANAAAERLFAAGEEDSEGRRRAVTMNNMLFSAALSSRVLSTEPERRELLLVDPSDGSDLLYELLPSALLDAREGTVVVSVLRDLSDLQRATRQIEENLTRLRIVESEVRAERDRLDLVIDSVADPILVTDPGGHIFLLNAPAERLFAAPTGMRHRRAARAVLSNHARFSSFVSNLFLASTEGRAQGEFTLTDPVTSADVPLEAVAGKILSPHGELSGVVTILHDRTEAIDKMRLYSELKRASEALEEKVRVATAGLVRQNELLKLQHVELEQASVAKSDFLASVSHEFRTPLTAILGYTSMLLQGVMGAFDARQRKAISRIDSNAQHLSSFIDDVLDIARIESGRVPMRLRRFHLRDLVSEVAADLEPTIAASGLRVRTRVEDMPPARTDRGKVKQILLNLLSNALKFTPKGWVKVDVRYHRAGDRVSITVADSGVGISAEEQAQVFEAFRQAKAQGSLAVGGTGLGLAICRRLAGMLGGELTLLSELGRGSTFKFTFRRRIGGR